MKPGVLAFFLLFYFVQSPGQSFVVSSGRTYETLKDVHDVLPQTLTEVVNIYIDGAVKIQPDSDLDFASNKGTSYFQWTRSGSVNFPINILPYNNTTASINRHPLDTYKVAIMIFLKDVKYINIKGIEFPDGFLGVHLVNADSCKIDKCRFIIGDFNPITGGGAIVLTSEDADEDPCNNFSENNSITDNYIEFLDDIVTVSPDNFDLFHGIYLARSKNNIVLRNTIVNPPGAGVHTWHGCTQNNTFKHNFTYQCKNHADSLDGLRHGFIIGPNGGTVTGNIISINYFNASRWVLTHHARSIQNSKGPNIDVMPPDEGTGSDIIVYGDNISNNTFSNNSFYYELGDAGDYTPEPIIGNYAYDPMYLSNFDPTKYTNRMISGDFNNDGIKNEIALFYDYGNTTTGLKMFGSENKKFKYLNEGWWADNFDITRIDDRVSSGDFDGDGDDDIATFFDEGNGNSVIYVFKSNGQSFTFNAPISWRSFTNYNPVPTNGKMIAGDFDNDGKDDVATIYAINNSEMEIHFFKSTGTEFNFPLVWKYMSNYNANKITGRVLSGDFNNDQKDDIVAFFDEGNGNSQIHFFSSNGSGFDFPQVWLTRTNYNPNVLTRRMVAGDFNFDNRLDIAGLADEGTNTSAIHVFLKDSLGSFQPPVAWWQSQEVYEATKATGRIVVGEFDDTYAPSNPFHRPQNDIAVFYQCESIGNGLTTRSNVFESTGNEFESANEWLGYPWLMDSITCTESSSGQNSNENNESIGLNIYPNPITTQSVLEIHAPSNERIERILIYNTHGKLLFDDKSAPGFGSHGKAYKISTLVSENALKGTCIVKIITNKRSKHIRFIHPQ